MPTYEPGEYIKAEFKDDHSGESEWMWVKVDYCDDSKRLVFGWLDNLSFVFPEKLKLGQHLAIGYDNIREHRKPSEARKT